MGKAEVLLVGDADGIEVTSNAGVQWIAGDLDIAIAEDGSLHIHDNDRTVAVYASGTWMRAKRVVAAPPTEETAGDD